MKKVKLKHITPLTEALDSILKACKDPPVNLDKVCTILAGRGYAFMLILFSLPFCIPITIPGFSTPFGLLLAFLGLRLAFGKHPWWPEWILKKEISPPTLTALISKVKKVVNKIQKVLHPRFSFLVAHPLAYRFHGILIFFLGILLSLPLPIPFTNTLAALPIFCLGLGLLEDDGVAIMIAYALALICFTVFGFLFWFGGVSLHKIVMSM